MLCTMCLLAALLCVALLCFASERKFWLQKNTKKRRWAPRTPTGTKHGVLDHPRARFRRSVRRLPHNPPKKQRFRQISAAVAKLVVADTNVDALGRATGSPSARKQPRSTQTRTKPRSSLDIRLSFCFAAFLNNNSKLRPPGAYRAMSHGACYLL